MQEEIKGKIRSLITELREFIDVKWRWCRCADECFDGFNLMLLKIQENRDLVYNLKNTDDIEAEAFLDEINRIVTFALKQCVALYPYRSRG